MGFKEPLILDFIKGKYFGAYCGEEPDMNGRKKLLHRPMGLKSFYEEKQIDYALTEDDIFNFTSPIYGQIMVLIPGSNIPHIDREQTIFNQINQTQQQRIKELEKQNEELKNKLDAKKKELDYLKDEEAEKKKRKQDKRAKIRCDGCGEEWSMAAWRQNGGCAECGSSRGTRVT